MAGIYIHIPFCRKFCNYCDFYRSNHLSYKEKLLECMLMEIEQKQDYLENEKIESIYIGGGTPSILTVKEINSFFSKIYTLFDVSSEAEITFEANPDDFTHDYIQELKEDTRINRLSIGIQSFIDRDLILLNRRLDSFRAVDSVGDAYNAGFTNISIDLIYAIPGMSIEEWESNCTKAFALNIKHLSAYHLTYEPNTVFYEMLNNKRIIPATEEESIRQYSLLIEMAEQNQFEHYEISNFSQKGFRSCHNASYWKGRKYLGIGPSAHSYNLISRQWNISDNMEYIKRISKNEKYHEIEFLDLKTKFNEYVMTGLRTMWGINLNDIKEYFGDKMYNQLIKSSLRYIENGKIISDQNNYILSREGKLIADYIISALFLE